MVVIIVKTGKAASLPYLMALLEHSFLPLSLYCMVINESLSIASKY